MKKLLVSDFDRTFYLNPEDLKANIKKVKEFISKGNMFVIATGRSFYDIMLDIDKYGVEYNYLIVNHGATILDKDKNILKNYLIDDNTKNKLEKQLNIEDELPTFCCSILESRVSIKTNDLTKIHLEFETPEIAKKVNIEINENYGEEILSYLLGSKSNIIEIISAKTNKAIAIEKLANIKNIDKKQIYTIGDSYSDIEMLKEFNGNCMKNSEEEIKKIISKQYASVRDLIDELMGENDEK